MKNRVMLCCAVTVTSCGFLCSVAKLLCFLLRCVATVYYYDVLYRIFPYGIALNHVLLLQCVVLCCVVLCCVVLCCVVLYCSLNCIVNLLLLVLSCATLQYIACSCTILLARSNSQQSIEYLLRVHWLG